MQTAADMPIEMTNKETEQTNKLPPPISGTIISTNGLKITSRLNPDAKEFYPSYLLRQKIMREIGDVGGGSALTQPLQLTHNANVLKVIKIDSITATASDEIGADVNVLKEQVDDVKAKEADAIRVVDEIKAPNVREPVKVNSDNGRGLDVELKKKEEEAVQLASKVTVTQLNLDNGKKTKQVEEDVRGSEEDSTDFEDAEGEPMMQPVSAKANKFQLNQLELNNAETKVAGDEGEPQTVRNNGNNELSENVSDEENREQYSDQSSNETLNEFKCKEDTESVEVSELSEENELAEEEALHELPQILEEIKEFNSLCGDGDGDVECETDAVCDCVGIGDGDGDVPPEYNTQQQQQPSDKPTNVADGDVATGGSTATPPGTPNEVCKSPTGKSRLGKVKLLKEKEDKKKTEKRTTLRKLASISLSLRGKNSAHHSEKTSTRSSSSVMTRTKRFSESLHNLTMGHKPKTDSKKTEGSSRLLPRSVTNIPRPPTARVRTTLSRATTESNGMNYKAPKTRITSSVSTANHSVARDTTSLKSVSSTEQSLAVKTTTHSSRKSLVSKSSNAALEKSGIPTVTATKSKDSVGKVRPRGTHASTLRQNEAQKRRNLFPNDDVESNIELSQFLFK